MSKITEFALPNSWIKVPLKELLEIQYGKSLSAKFRVTTGSVPVSGSSGIVGCHTEALVTEDCIVIGRKGSVGAVYLFEVPCWPIDTTYFIHTPIGLLLRYTYYQLNTLALATLDKSTTIPGLNRDHLYDVKFALAPLKEQTRIVEKIEELFSDLDAGVAELKAAQKKMAQYRQSLLKAAVEGELTAEWRKNNKVQESGAQLLARILAERRTRWEAKQLAKFKEQGKTPPKGWQDRYSEPVKPDAANLPGLPEGWVWASVDQCSAFEDAAITDGPFGSNLKSAHYTESGPRVIRLKNIGEGIFIDAKAHISEDHYLSLKKHAVEAEDIVVAMLGEDLPRSCLIPEGIAPGIVKADCARIRVKSDMLLPAFLNTCLNSQNTKQRVSSLIKGIGRPRINLQHIRGICIPLPPMAEQAQIVSIISDAFDKVDCQVESIQFSLKQSAAQRKNILKSAFSGQLVAQDPSDEPASLLLERIRAKRAAQSAHDKSRQRKSKPLHKDTK